MESKLICMSMEDISINLIIFKTLIETFRFSWELIFTIWKYQSITLEQLEIAEECKNES